MFGVDVVVLVVRAFKQNYRVVPEVRDLLETYKLMVNTCIRLGLQANLTSRNGLSKLCYHELAQFRLHTWYRLYAISVAASALKGYRRAIRKGLTPRKPYIHRLFAQIGSQAFKIEDNRLRLPIGPREWFYIPLSNYILKNISDPTLRLGSVLLKACILSISVKKNAEPIEPRGMVGIDTNEDSAFLASEEGHVQEYNFKEIPKIIQTYREVLSHFKRNDARIRREIAGKYGARRRNKIIQGLHKVSKAIVEKAVEKKQGIALERLTGIRESHCKGNYEGRKFRYRLNSWPFHELQRQIIYKATWNGIPTIMVDPSRTSRLCSVCGCLTRKSRKWLVCHVCGSILNRHENAARNILARGVRFAPVGVASEAMLLEPITVIQKVDATQPSPHPTET